MEIDLTKVNIKGMIKKIRESATRADSEEDFKIDAVQILRKEVLDKFELPYGKFEKGIFVSGVRGRADVLYGHLFIEFEKPGVLKQKAGFTHSTGQLERYIKGTARIERALPRFFGVTIDGYQIGFVRFVEREKAWSVQGPYNVNEQTVFRLLEALRGLSRKPLDAEHLIKDFGPESTIGNEVVKLFSCKLENLKSDRAKTLFDDWERVFSQVCAYSAEKIEGLEKFYGLAEDMEPKIVLFTIHSYYALIMKLIAAEVAVLFGEPFMQSYIRKLEDAYLRGHQSLKMDLEELEAGGIFSQIGITNFIEADYFSWYLDEWDEDIAKAIIIVVRGLSNYEVGTAELEPERIKDLFKRLYQYLVPKKIRHDLGEYYTPDWLADLLLNEIDYKGNPNFRLLDPACGSGTFIVQAIRRIKQYRDEHFLSVGDALDKITKNIVGFDLNPLAVLASRTNYLIAIGDYLRQRRGREIRIPIFLADSIAVERRSTLFGKSYVLRTHAGEFGVPTSIVEKGELGPVLSLIRECVENRYKSDEFKERLIKEISDLREQDISILIQLFETLANLERKGRNKIWVGILRNSFAPFFEGKFDYVVGNPPWINWESLPESYREVTKSLWEQYGLTEKTKGMGLGKVKRDMAMLFLTRCFDRYVNGLGKLSFLMPFTTYKTQAGAGFRKYLTYRCRVNRIHDLVELYPFEGATNRTSMISIEKGRTKFTIPCTMWSNPKSVGIPQEVDLKTVYNTTRRTDMILAPLEVRDPMHPWMITSEAGYEVLKKITSYSVYKSHAGSYTALSAAYWVNVLSREPNGILIENSVILGKKKVKKFKACIKPDLVYPLVRGREVDKWYFSGISYIIVPHDERTGNPVAEGTMKVDYNKTYSYLHKFRVDLEKRPIHKLWGKGKPFYTIYDLGSYSFFPYKVVWKDITGKISGKQEIIASVIAPYKDRFLGTKTPIIDNTLLGIHVRNLDEAHYLCSILNSSLVRAFVSSYTHLHVRPYVIEKLNLTRYDTNNPLHRRLSEHSKKAHKLAKKYYEQKDLLAQEELKEVEREIDKTVARLYGINHEELREVKKILKIFQGKFDEIEEEIEVVEKVFPPVEPVKIEVKDTVIQPNKPFVTTFSVRNNGEKVIKNVETSLFLLNKLLSKNIFDELNRKETKSFEISLPALKAGSHNISATLGYEIEGRVKKKRKNILIFAKKETERVEVQRSWDEFVKKFKGNK